MCSHCASYVLFGCAEYSTFTMNRSNTVCSILKMMTLLTVNLHVQHFFESLQVDDSKQASSTSHRQSHHVQAWKTTMYVPKESKRASHSAAS